MTNTHHHSGAGWTIRQWETGDTPGIMHVFRDCLKDFPWRGDAAPYERRLLVEGARYPVFVAHEPRAGIVGFMTADMLDGYVSHLFVHRDWRFCGIGTEMLAIARANAKGPIRLDVDIQNKAAQAAYAALGWRVMEAAGDKNGPHQIRMISP